MRHVWGQRSCRALADDRWFYRINPRGQTTDPTILAHKVIFAWSVREETGLEGARAMAVVTGVSKRVFSIDTFVSSDSPAESTRFGMPRGKWRCDRGLDNSAAATPAEFDRVL